MQLSTFAAICSSIFIIGDFSMQAKYEEKYQWMMNDEYLILNTEYWILNTEYWKLNDEWWLMNDDSWMMNDERWMTNNNEIIMK
jgi:hypothetical protein